MKNPPTSRLPIFRSDGQAAVLAELFLYSPEPLSLTDLSQRVGLSLGAVHAEVERLEEAGLIGSQRMGRSRLVSANHRSPFYPELLGLLTKAFGPNRLLEEHLAAIDGIDQAFVYGSWASSEAGLTTGQPRDIDVMVIGHPDLDQLYQGVRRVEIEAGRPVNVTVLSPEEWDAGDSGFLREVREGPKVAVA